MEQLRIYKRRDPSAGRILVECAEYIPDAYDCLMEAVEEGEIILQKYEDLSEASLQWIHQTMMKEYETASEEYQYFLRNHFAFLQSAHL